MSGYGIYIHIPFCNGKCYYCDFTSFPLRKNNEIATYIDLLTKEIEIYTKYESAKEVDTIYFGGGTPSILTPLFIEQVLNKIFKNFKIKKETEITIECNPENLTFDYLKNIKKAGINRVSTGIQTFNNHILKTIGRRGDKKAILNALEYLFKSDIKNISIDLMYGLPYQTKEEFLSDIEFILKTEVKHISIYALHLDKRTPLYRIYQKNPEIFPDEDSIREMYLEAREKIIKKGFIHYEISNFALKGYECRHNLKYWKMENYIGFGVSAVSFENRFRRKNTSNLHNYLKLLKKEIIPVIYAEKVEGIKLLNEKLMLGLRLIRGVKKSEIKKILEKKKYIIKNYKKEGFIVETQDYIRLTPEGIIISNRIISDLMI